MDHEVRDHVHIRGPLDKFTHALDLDEAGMIDVLRQGHDAGVEAFQMANLQNGPALIRQIDDALALLPSRRDGFLQ